MQATDDKTMAETSRREPMEGPALFDFVAKLVARNYPALRIARKASIPYARARKMRAEILRAESEALAADLTPEEKEQLKRENVEYLCSVRDASAESYQHSVSQKEPNARQHNPGVAATKILNTMLGFDAPTRTVNTDIRIYAQVQPKDMDRVLADPRARAAMLEFEEVVSQINSAEPEPEVVIDVTPDAEGGPA